MLGPNEVVISDLNWQEFMDPASQVVDGEQKAKGLVPRDYTRHPVGSYGSAVPYWAVQMKTIPRDQWPQRVKDKILAKSQLSDIRMAGNGGQRIPALDQNGQGFSHSEDTEVLTVNGFVRWPDWNHTDPLGTVNLTTGLMEFQHPTEWHAYEYDDEMYYSTNRRLDFGVTRNHRMLVRKWDERRRTLSDTYTMQRADELGWYVGMMAAPKGFVGTELHSLSPEGMSRRYNGDDFLAMVSLVCSDGYAGSSDSTSDLVSFCCFHGRRYPAVAALAGRVGFKEQSNRPGVWTCRNAALARWIRANCYVHGQPHRAQAKKVPDIFKWTSRRQIELFLQFFGDKNHGDGADETYYSTSKRMIDDLQELLMRVGKRSTVCNRGPRSTVYKATGQVINGGPSYALHVSSTDRLCIDRKKHIETDRYKGLVYCATVPNGNLITRRNGTVLHSGNCWMYSGTACVMLLRAAMNQPYVRLSAHAGACIIKNYRDEGGWGAQGLDFLVARGQPSVEFWPEKSMNRANDNEATWTNAALHKVTEGFVDLQAAQYDRNLTFEQVATCLLLNIPVIGDFNHWGHSVALMDLVDGVSLFNAKLLRMATGKLITQAEFDVQWSMNDVGAGYGVRLLNSWTDNWSDRGQGVLSGNKAIPDGATAPRVTIPSYTGIANKDFDPFVQSC